MSGLTDERIVRLLDEDVDLAERIPDDRRTAARQALPARMVTLAPGTQLDRALARHGDGVHGLLLVGGLISRSTRLADTTTVQLLGAGDLIEAPASGDGRLVPIEVGWTVLEPTRAIVVDDALVERAQRWPEVLAALFDRVASQSARMGMHCAISSLARVEDRIETLLWFLAERWGRVGSHGVVLPLRLTHETLGQMLGAKRPTVSLALKQLAADGLVERRGDGAWLLRRHWQDAPVAVEQTGGGVRLLPSFPHAKAILQPSLPDVVPAPVPAPAPPLSPAGLGQLQARVERMTAVHDRMHERVSSTLASAAQTRERSMELRSRVRADQAAAHVQLTRRAHR
jgi:CRP-like cAMP-binding protein